jgi:ABC-type uncharacterized transport system substrate-binding protein
VLAGCLFSYSADTRRTFLQAIACVAKVLAGARPADIPWSVPDRYELAFNLQHRQGARPDDPGPAAPARREGDR